MFSGLLKRRGQRAKRNDSPAMPYHVECVCGKTKNGARGEKAQVVRCSGCGGQILIFPSSPLPLLRETIRDALRHPARKPATPSIEPETSNWRRPLVAAGVTLAVVVAGFIILLNTLFRSGIPSPPTNGEALARDEEIARPLMNGAHEMPVRNPAVDPLDRRERLRGVRLVVEDHEHAARDLREEEKERDPTEVEDEALSRHARG